MRNSHARIKANRSNLGTRMGGRTNMRSILNEAFEWLDRAEHAREVAGLLTDPSARRAVSGACRKFRSARPSSRYTRRAKERGVERPGKNLMITQQTASKSRWQQKTNRELVPRRSK